MRIVNKSDVKEHLQELLAVQITEDMPIYEVYDDSIKMFQVLSKINNGFHINLGMIDLVMCDTVDKLIEKITLESKNVVNIVGEEQLSLIQQSYWIGREQEFYGASNSTHLYLEVHHNLDLMKLEKVIRTLIKRHGALRSIIKEEKQFIFEEKIADTFCLETINIGREEKEKYFKKLRYNNQTRLRDLENWPLFDVKNICIDTCENFLLVDIEMIIVDGMSLQLILKDFWDIYSNSKFDVQEIDYLKCAKSVRETRDKRKYEIDKEYWMQRLPLIPNAPKLPECKIWDESNICSRLQRKIEKEEWAALEKMAKDSGVTVSIVLLYAYLLTLARWSEEPQFTINVTLSSRPYTVRDIEKVVGDFTTNILFDFSASDMKGTIAEQLKFIRNKLYEYCDHSSYEGVEIIRDMIKTGKISQEKPLPIVFTSMLFGNLPNLSEMDVVYSQSQTSQVSLDNQTYKLEDGGLIVWDFIKKIYPETMVEEMFSYYCMVIEQLSKNDGELKCSPAFEKKIKLYNSTEKEIDFFNLGKRLDNIFYKFADKIAITDFEGGITYRELERNIKSTMHDLKKNGIKPGKYVVIKTDKSKESIISIPYGYPLTNQSIYILDSEQRICPPEVIGEIYIGGIGVAKGYINDEEKTSNSFVKSKYGRLYRTGDFGKYSREGYVIFCGRRDSQVKIGGYRIELEEIEAQIKEVPNIKDCIAVVNYKNQIVVFYKGEELDIAEIKRAIRKKLPTYMYPHRYYRVDDFPLNTNEKIDRKMLKSMADSGIQNKMHNEKQDDLRNPSLNKVIEIWSEVLNCDVEPENDFFELGGDSIKAQRIVRKIADNFKVKISFLTVIHSKNVAEFSKEVEKISLSFKNSKKDEATSAGSKQDKESKKVEYAMMKRQKKFSIYVRKIPTLVIGSYNDQCVILQAVKDNAKIHTAELKIVDSVCHDMMLDPDWRNIADLIFKFIEKTIDKKSGDNYNDNYVSTQAHQGGE